MKVAVIYTGGYDQVLHRTFNTREWEAYALNARDIGRALDALGHEVTPLVDGKALIANLERNNTEFAWICTGGIQGRHSVAHTPSILEMLGIPYVGSPPLVAAIADHKPTAKKIIAFEGLPTPAFQVFRDVQDKLNPALAFPLIVKPATGLCSCGVYKVQTEKELRSRVQELLQRYHAEVLVEEYIDGRDFTVPVLSNGTPQALPLFERVFYDREQALQGLVQASIPHEMSTLAEASRFSFDLPSEARERIRELAIRSFRALDILYFGRVDIRLDREDNPYFLELNFKPNLTEDSIFAASARKVGISYVELVNMIFEKALRRSCV